MNKRKNKPSPCGGRRLCGRPGLSPDGVAGGCAPAPPPGNPTGREGPWVAWAGATTRSWGRRGAGGSVCRGICRWRGPGAPTAAPAALCRGHRVVPSAAPGAAETGAGVAFRCQGPHTAGSHPTHRWHLRLGTGEPMAPLLPKPSGRGQKQRFGGALGFTPAFLLVGRKVSPPLFSSLPSRCPGMNFLFFFLFPLPSFFFSPLAQLSRLPLPRSRTRNAWTPCLQGRQGLPATPAPPLPRVGQRQTPMGPGSPPDETREQRVWGRAGPPESPCGFHGLLGDFSAWFGLIAAARGPDTGAEPGYSRPPTRTEWAPPGQTHRAAPRGRSGPGTRRPRSAAGAAAARGSPRDPSPQLPHSTHGVSHTTPPFPPAPNHIFEC